MAYPANIYSQVNVAGTTLLASDDHADRHNDIGAEIAGIEATLGTNSGTSVLKNFTAGQFALSSPGGTLTSGVINGTPQIGTPMVRGGTIGTAVIGTSTIQGGTANDQVVGSPAITGGTATSILLTTPSFSAGAIPTAAIADGAVTSQKTTLTKGYGTLSAGTTASTSLVNITGGSAVLVLAATSNVLTWFSGNSLEGGANHEGTIALVRDSTVIHSVINRFVTAGVDYNITAIAMDVAVAAGTYTYKVQQSTNAGTITTVGKFGAIVFS